MGTQKSQMSQQANLKEICIFTFINNKKAFQWKPNSPLDNRSGIGVGVFVPQVNRFKQFGDRAARDEVWGRVVSQANNFEQVLSHGDLRL